MSEFYDAVAFYDRHYDIIGNWFLIPGQKIMLGDTQNRVCRFCGKRSPEVTFESEAHAIPEALGNKSIFSAYECDVCNHMFGLGACPRNSGFRWRRGRESDSACP